ncbi:MAG: DUF1844 domain-containing protein [Rubripirellula sp.]|nr:DUF1844 domain-containing protein [Rubripirellula sp.]
MTDELENSVSKESEDCSQTVDAKPASDTKAAEEPEGSPPPPASFEMLVSMLFSQAMAMLGHIPDPQSGQTSTNKPYAKYTIDTLEMLSQKTKGNLSDDEDKMLAQTLHALRMAYVEVR